MASILLQLLLFNACVVGMAWLIQKAVEEKISWWVCLALVASLLGLLWRATPDLVFGTTGST